MMESNKFTTLGALLLALLFMVSAIPVHAAGLAHSSNVLVLNTEGDAAGEGSAGDFPTSAVTGAGYSVTFMAAGSVTGASSFNGYDTIVMWMYCGVGSDTTVQGALTSFLQNGGKILVWDSDACSDGFSADYSWLSGVGAAFAVTTPGQTGSFGGSLTIVEANNFLSGLTSTEMSTLVSDTDAVGDLNVITTSASAWCATLDGTNILSESGFAEAYTAPGALTGATGAMIVYNGLDTDYIGTTAGTASGDEILVTMVLNQLAHGWGDSAYTSDLTCGVPVSGIKLDPLTATNTVGTSHTVTATVTDTSTGLPVSGVTVTFLVTAGPNVGTTGTAVTGSSGTATFTYSDTGGAGTDSIVASFTTSTGAVVNSNAVEKIWTTTTGVPEFGLPAMAMAALGLVAILSLRALMGRKPKFP